MATTNFNILHLHFSRRVRDPVADATTAGKVYSAANRSDFLNRAITVLQQKLFSELGADGVRRALFPHVATQALTFGGTAITLDTETSGELKMIAPLAVVKASSTNLYKYHPRREELTSNVNPDIPYAFTIEGGSLYVYESGSIPSTGTGTFYYLQREVVTQTTGTDIKVPPAYWTALVDIAVTLAVGEDKRPVSV